MLKFWKNIKAVVSSVPKIYLVIAFAVLVYAGWAFSSDIGKWVSDRSWFASQRKDEAYRKQIETLNAEKEGLLRRAVAAEAREQTKALEAELLKQEAARLGVNVAAAQQRIDTALGEYAKDTALIEAVKEGKVTMYDLCIKQCADSATIGYPCKPNYCKRFEGR